MNKQQSLIIIIISFFITTILPIVTFLETLKYNSGMSHWIMLFSGILSIAIAYWWRLDVKSFIKTNHTNFYAPCWRNGLMLFALTVGICQIIYTSTKLLPDGFLQTKFKEDASQAAGIMAIVVTVVTAYYLVTLQGTWTQSRELLGKLQNRENELRKLHDEIFSVNQNFSESSDLFRIVGKLLIDIQILPKEKIQDHIGMLSKTIEIYDTIFHANLTNHTNSPINQIHSNISDIIYRIKHSDALIHYIPSGLLHQTTKYLNRMLKEDTIRSDERDLAKDTLKDIKKLEETIRFHFLRI